ncbi:LLM class flavin-dependent oxidoreductase [Longimicrobium terrae]|uniref:Alkanesulfonate monooxygenase SsuD/methylene tetrahydromethanopterin reductase-like flavin-dependent oxidoreductase (Luciferase family) n=1 Tax=Longimicrobium terrae TaxID=1639882 RepID=A0A841GSX2_9BACT|nr:LLM class flavin-dependent oxidoreductase [Longimicrobium terrae]MBB4636034.1 alkanesulfonate monooxygenase SsuD/methylene tetrahydromethanopterin reductase-like flavin-dependent oxidoreductase (luciferase family) [Longimicrobium terrae]MBB6070430.1 alkanesulfonate monooxygenase SsuD/methylene tetrahydromethanopterin reductase-like flavin-dependent oxidoreductase (luciferase family) [Longimicrobium terrae]NNC30924.1 LLM class flavin-dependent oxidoreductase [Longimicrobium terrae]
MTQESGKAFELGVYTFGNTPRTADGGSGSTAQAIRDALEAVHLAEEVGLDFFGFGEHHTRSMPISSPTSLVNAAAASTRRIKLGTTVTVLSTDEPVRVFQQLATAAAIAPGRIEVVAGRGSSAITFPIFDFEERDYDVLFSSKLELLLALNRDDRVTWSGAHRRRPLEDVLIVPRPEQPLRIWLGTGGSPESVMRAVELGVPMFLGILGGTPEHWAQYGRAYRAAWTEAGHPADAAAVAVAVHGFVGENDREAKATYLEHELRMFQTGSAEIGRPGRAPAGRGRDMERGGMVFAGGPDEVAERILHLHDLLGHSRQILQMDVGGMPHATFLKSIELLGTRVLPLVRKALEGR